jgi:phosphopantothenoylcysteine decarboxylase/phosphopantothenate--cysteine ligase
MARILLGVSGGIAAYKALELVRLATAAGHAVRVVQTPNSRRFVGEASFAALTGAPVLVSEFEPDPARGAFPGQQPPAHQPLSHLELVANAEVYLIAPASANTIAKLAGGHADNLLGSCALAATCPVLVAPAMNNSMYEHPATRANLRTLEERGVGVIGPGAGRLASQGEHGVGRLAEPAELLVACEAAIGQEAGRRPVETGAGSLSGLTVLVTAGGTREPIDSVRYLGNSSSGRMGLALASAARSRGAEVKLVAANVAIAPPPGIDCRVVVTAAELKEAYDQEFPACDVLLMAAAVADFRPSAPQEGKLKKAGRTGLELELEPTPDVLA